jgi:hypothetical protein
MAEIGMAAAATILRSSRNIILFFASARAERPANGVVQ